MMYKKLALVVAINAVVMYLLMYVMINDINHLYLNLNTGYMTLMMVAPMVVLKLVVMRSMYENTKLNNILIAAFSVLFILCFWLTRTQTPIGDKEFLRSMIPHHSSAVLMCRQADITDPEIIQLCEQIVKSQEGEIIQMQTIFNRLR